MKSAAAIGGWFSMPHEQDDSAIHHGHGATVDDYIDLGEEDIRPGKDCNYCNTLIVGTPTFPLSDLRVTNTGVSVIDDPCGPFCDCSCMDAYEECLDGGGVFGPDEMERLRENKGLSRRELSERIGVSTETLRLWARGATPTPANELALKRELFRND